MSFGSTETLSLHYGKVGIGTTAPTVPLDVVGAGKFTGQVTIPATPSASTDAASKGYVDSQVGSADTLQEVTDNGNTTTNSIGIGTTSPDKLLHLEKSSSTSGEELLRLENPNTDGKLTKIGFITNGLNQPQTQIFGGNDNSGQGGQGGNSGAGKFKVTISNPSGTHQEVIYAQNDSSTTNKFTSLSAGGSEIIRLRGDGNVGIGTTNPDEKLEVAGKTHLGGRGQDGGAYIGYASLSETQGGAATILGNAVYAGNANNVYRKTSGDVGNFIKMVYSKGITFHTNVTGNAGSTEYSVENNEQMRIDLNGNVGIGATAPSVGLQLGNSTSGQTKTAIFNSEGGVEAGLTIKSRTNRAKLAVSDNDTTAYVVAEGTIASFGRADTAASTNISVLANGDVGIGTTSPSRLLTLENNSSTVTNNSQLRINNAGAGDAYIYLFAGSDWSLGIDNSDSDKFKLCTTNDVSDGTEVVTVDRNGNVGIGTTSPQAKLQVSGGIQMADDTDTASAAKVGTMRYRTATNEPVAVTGIELVTNGNFATASSWTKSSNVTISGGQATFTANSAAQYIIQGSLWAANSLSGQKVQLTYTIVSNSLNAGDFRIGGYTGASAFTLQGLPATVGTHSVTLDVRTSGGDDNAIDIYITSPATSGALVIDNLSLIHVTEEDASYADMCMQTAASTYEWVNIVRNSY
jgi:hypothetical protein